MAKSLEAIECKKYNAWLLANSRYWPVLEMITHIPNEGKRSYKTGIEMVNMGMRKGVADFVLLAGGKIPGIDGVIQALALEFKSPTGKQSPDQKRWQRKFESFGGVYRVVTSAELAAQITKAHLKLKWPT